jgi:hypothetical protein
MSRRSESPQVTSWQLHLNAWQSSEQTQAAYCREHDLAYCQFTYWKQKLVQKVASAPCDSHSGFVPVEIINGRSSSLTICLPNGASIEGVSEDNCQLARDLAKALL